jgi:uncharacterized protein (DUF2252 family)
MEVAVMETIAMQKISMKTRPAAKVAGERDARGHRHELTSVPTSRTSSRTAQIAVQDRIAAGKALRDELPRARHAEWKKNSARKDPVEVLHAADADRLPDLVPIRYGRMLQSPFAFYRGAAGVMAADLARTPSTGIRVQTCGDCHLLNFGGFATPERNVVFDINDFDETLPGPWEWDIKRLVASFILAARSIGQSDAKGREAVMTCSGSYRNSLRHFSEMNPLKVWYGRETWDDLIKLLPPARRRIVRDRVAKALKQGGSEVEFPKLAGVVGGQVVIRDAPPLIFHPQSTHAPAFKATIDQTLAAYRDTLADDHRVLLDRYRVVDEAIKVVGVGSVGRRCWIALLMSATNDPLFLQFKEAVASVLEPFAGRSVYAHHGQRAVMGQRLMQPASDLFLGWMTGPNGRHFYVRQLRDAKIKPLVDTFDAETLSIYAKACGLVLARAHAKSGDPGMISGYLGKSDQFDEAMADFAVAYADQAERDHAALKAAVRHGKVAAYQEVV